MSFPEQVDAKRGGSAMKHPSFVASLVCGLFIVMAYPVNAQEYRDACFNGPGTLVTGDPFTVNGNLYYAVVGTDGIDHLIGADDPAFEQRDIIWGLEGDDTLWGGDGDDIICGGEGADTLNGGDDDDTLLGEFGGDVLNGDAGSDRIEGGGGDDELNGGDGDDLDSITISSGARAGLFG
ncbi:MAG: hypothetical protein OEU25_13410, partial [Rhodospirillales bacterium]|nr:hypothetical protein [Rhodospirillales bacterium]